MSFISPLRLTAVLLGLLIAPAVAFAAQGPLSDHQALYPRLVRISHDANVAHNDIIIASVSSFDGGGHQDIFASHDNGATFAIAGTVQDGDFAKGLCCGGLYELPATIGAMPAGTLLWAGSVGGDTPADPMQIKIYKSTDQGAHWTYLSNCVTGTKPRSQGGLWEPEFTIAGNGHLVCFYSDETQTGHSQTLSYVQSADGVTWSTSVNVVASADANDRPGMANVVKLPDGPYVMSFEMCGPLNCAAFMKTSADALTWGDATSHGTAIALADGTTFWHTPTLTWAPTAGTTHGQLVLQGQILVKNGVVQPGNGKTLFINAAGDGTGAWTAFDAPVTVSMPDGTAGNYCENYSSPLLAVDNGKTVLQLASDFDGTVCKTYVNRAALGGVSLNGGNIAVTKGSSATGDFTLNAGPSFAGSYNLSVDVPGIPADVTLSDASVTLSPASPATVHLTVKPTASADAGSYNIAYAGLFGTFLFGAGGLAVSKSKVAGALVVASCLTLSGCGGSGGSGGTTPPTTVSIDYAGTITATHAVDATVTATANFKITLTKTA